MVEFSQVKGSVMDATMEMAEEKYGGMEGYMRDALGFSDQEIEQIRANLRR